MTKYFTMTESQKEALEERLCPIASAYDKAYQALEFPMFSLKSSTYNPIGGHLSLNWIETFAIKAHAYPRRGQKIDHVIAISYGMLKALWRDSLSFGIHSKYLFGLKDDNAKNQIYELFKIKGRELDQKNNIIPSGANLAQCVETIFCLAVTWLFKHESSHLLQNHGQIRADAMPIGGDKYLPLDVSEFSIPGDYQPQSESESLVWHVTELAADYEAVYGTISTLYLNRLAMAAVIPGAKGVVQRSDLWMLFVAINLIFFRFWEGNKKVFSSIVNGTHPHPAIRSHMAARAVFSAINNPANQSVLGTSFTLQDLLDIADDAFTSSVLYWAARHVSDDEFKTSFLELAAGLSVDSLEYLGKARRVWDAVKIPATNYHLNKGWAQILEFDSDLLWKIDNADYISKLEENLPDL